MSLANRGMRIKMSRFKLSLMASSYVELLIVGFKIHRKEKSRSWKLKIVIHRNFLLRFQVIYKICYLFHVFYMKWAALIMYLEPNSFQVTSSSQNDLVTKKSSKQLNFLMESSKNQYVFYRRLKKIEYEISPYSLAMLRFRSHCFECVS